MARIFREGTNPVWGAVVAVWVLGSLALDFYWLFTESGVMRWMAEWQASLLGGKWYPKLGFVIVLLAQIVVLLLVKLVIERATGKKLTAPRS